MRDRSLDAVEGPDHVYLENIPQVFRLQLRHLPGETYSRIVHENVEHPKLGDGFIYQRLHRSPVGNVGLYPERLAAGGKYLYFEGPQLFLVPGGEYDCRAPIRQCPGRRFPDTARSPGNYCYSVFQCLFHAHILAGYTSGVAKSGKILVGVTGGIAAYKAPGVIRRLREAGYEVKVAATDSAFRFIPRETLAIAAGSPVNTDETWWEESGKVEHVGLARWADLVLVAPATADSMARASIGLGDDLISATILAGAKKVLWAPAMNPEMWSSPATKRNVATLSSWDHQFVGPAKGTMASSEEEPGVGRLAEESEIVAAVEKLLPRKS